MTTATTPQSDRRTIDAVWRIESPRLIAGLVRMLRDIGEAANHATGLPMEYLMTINIDEKLVAKLPAVEYDELMRGCLAHADELRRDGKLLGSGQLEPPTNAKTLRVRHGKTLIVYGPFAETKELLAGFNLLRLTISMRPFGSRRNSRGRCLAASKCDRCTTWVPSGTASVPDRETRSVDAEIAERVAIGTASWTDKSLVSSKRFYPKGCNSAEERLRYYASQFAMVEVDSSYYA